VAFVWELSKETIHWPLWVASRAAKPYNLNPKPGTLHQDEIIDLPSMDDVHEVDWWILVVPEGFQLMWEGRVKYTFRSPLPPAAHNFPPSVGGLARPITNSP